MSALVLDASTTLAWCFEEAQTPYAMGILAEIVEGADVWGPHIWPLEVANGLLKSFRRKHITSAELHEYARQIAALGAHVDLDRPGERAFQEALDLAQQQQLSSYDAAYLELAQRRGLPIATADANLLRAAQATGTPVFAP